MTRAQKTSTSQGTRGYDDTRAEREWFFGPIFAGGVHSVELCSALCMRLVIFTSRVVPPITLSCGRTAAVQVRQHKVSLICLPGEASCPTLQTRLGVMDSGYMACLIKMGQLDGLPARVLPRNTDTLAPRSIPKHSTIVEPTYRALQPLNARMRHHRLQLL